MNAASKDSLPFDTSSIAYRLRTYSYKLKICSCIGGAAWLVIALAIRTIDLMS